MPSMFCLKTRTRFLCFTLLLGLTCLVFLYFAENAETSAITLNNFVARTHQRLEGFGSKVQRPRFSGLHVYLRRLGFNETFLDVETSENAGSPTTHSTTNDEILKPTLIVPVTTHQNSIYALKLLRSLVSQLPGHTVVLVDLGLQYDDAILLKNACFNFTQISSIQCRYRLFDFEQFPGHVTDLNLEAYRPIVIQQELLYTPLVLYTNAKYSFTANIPARLLDEAKRKSDGAVISVEMPDSTSSMTHPRTFAFLGEDPKSYHFRHASSGDFLLIRNSKRIQNQLILPWIQCSLTFSCISPPGAQHSGDCLVDRRPLFLFSGCHGFDRSVFNVVFGPMLNYSAGIYSISQQFLSSFLVEEK